MRKLLAVFLLFTCSFLNAQTQPNFIFIVIDDLNDYVQGFGGHPQVETPNISELISSGYTFTNAFCSSPGCAPSRTSMLSGKDLVYTHIYNNEDYPAHFRDVFQPEYGNAEVFTLPEILKDSGGYYTYVIDKIFHNETYNDYQPGGTICNKPLSWNKKIAISDDELSNFLKIAYADYAQYGWAKIPDSYETQLSDYICTDSAIAFINAVASGTAGTCGGKPFFLGVGYHQPHTGRMVPEKYFNDFYMNDNYQYPLDVPYNEPSNAFPANGVVMPPQPPEGMWADFYALPENGIGQTFAEGSSTEENFSDYVLGLSPFPSVAEGLSFAEKNNILLECERANYVSVYLASIKYIDAQIGRLMDTLASHPALADNTVIILVSDNGYSLGEKKHYTKWGLWETDIRIPFVIVDPSRVGNKVCPRTVSLLDIFPTVLDMASVIYPKFSDGSDYLDGTSLVPLLYSPTRRWEKPALTAYSPTCTPDCNPSFSVRNERFHYIKYEHADSSYFLYDSLGNEIIEQELYDVGTQRQTDPNEWNNLGYNPDYLPVINYLDNFLPDSSMYLQQALKVEISATGAVACLLANTGKLKLKLKLYDTNGTQLGGTGLTAYNFKWTNNITTTESTSANYNFPLGTIPAVTYANTDKILFYLHVYETATGKLVAFDTKTFYLNPANTPLATYTTSASELAVTINAYTLTGSYTSSKWDFGDGTIVYDYIPATHTYVSPGTYVIKNTVYYGNGCSVIFIKTITLTEPIMKYAEDHSGADRFILMFPNPASTTLTVSSNTEFKHAVLEIYNMQGEMIKFFSDVSGKLVVLNIDDLLNGSYVIKIADTDNQFTSSLQVLK